MPILADPAAVAPMASLSFACDRCSLPAPDVFSGDSPTADCRWSPEKSAALYNVPGWGDPYFSVNGAGNIAVKPYGFATLPHQEIDLMKVVKKSSDPESCGGLGLQLPLIVRFPDVLKNRLESLQSAFDFAIQSNGYGSLYQGVYPVKCNQDRCIVEDIVEFGSPYRFGLEAGSKPELLLAMSCLTKGDPDAFLVCNGYKDVEYVSLALIARTLSLNTVIVLEQEEELDTVINTSIALGVRPVIGLRAKLRTRHSGHFGSTSGERGKFGLTTMQIVSVVQKLRRYGMLDCLQLLHFHIGSQIPSTALLSDGVGEAAQIYCELARLGASMRVIDIGGGLGIDYDGSKSGGSDMSVGYGLDEYAYAVVRAVQYVCDRKGIGHPIICSESGRALISHHSVLVFEAVSAPAAEPAPVAGQDMAHLVGGLTEEAGAEYTSLSAAVARGDYSACLVHAEQLKVRCVEMFKDGMIGMEQLAAVDGLCDLVFREIQAVDPIRTYHVNMSVFTSVPDFWAIGQLFPIVPIHRLDEKPEVKGVLSDLTCDSDGKIDRFIGGKGSLQLHEARGRYCLGMFLGGAYQEALGGMHNLFGGPSVVRVERSEGAHCFAVTGATPGATCSVFIEELIDAVLKLLRAVDKIIWVLMILISFCSNFTVTFMLLKLATRGTASGGLGRCSVSSLSPKPNRSERISARGGLGRCSVRHLGGSAAARSNEGGVGVAIDAARPRSRRSGLDHGAEAYRSSEEMYWRSLRRGLDHDYAASITARMLKGLRSDIDYEVERDLVKIIALQEKIRIYLFPRSCRSDDSSLSRSGSISLPTSCRFDDPFR